MKVLILGAGGIVGQHLRLYEPKNVETVYARTSASSAFFRGRVTIDRPCKVTQYLDDLKPDVVINLAGENRPDVVEKDPEAYRYVNERLPVDLGLWCDVHDKHLIHVSTQGVYNGNEPPYPAIPPGVLLGTPVNAYGRQKLNAERLLSDRCRNWTIARLTFVVGVRPLPHVGRKNPFEAMVEQLSTTDTQRQVSDRFFSPCFAHDAAKALWGLVERTHFQFGASSNPLPATFNIGTPERVSRFDIAKAIPIWGNNSSAPVPTILPVSHSEFPGLAERPKDTTYAWGSLHLSTLSDGIAQALKDMNGVDDRAVELALFFGCGLDLAKQRMSLGFGPNHTAVAADWRKYNPKTDEQILDWYRYTDSYCWELSAYHADPGFNYSGMCRGIAQHLKNVDPCSGSAMRVLCLGDGIGDLTLTLKEAGLDAIYHDLLDSTTAKFAAFRFERRGLYSRRLMTDTFAPPRVHSDGTLGAWPYQEKAEFLTPDAVVALDFFEHLPNVEEWARAVFELLAPGGLFLAQNAFGIGDEEHEGSIPMHLVVNNQYVAGWVPLLGRIGFVDAGGGWWRKP